ncbi:hypothetical protein BFJ69_g15941 [Fusarium oxysporum]|uniref:Kri1-like C-terminal domain-containing protein n=1 Tax=Fusarium oxysporum TaxID=5507 RepID=A0A420MCR0_FUSOX|nr:hypothetical protein BFJ69_g15941 [Fusarium oxysporum]
MMGFGCTGSSVQISGSVDPQIEGVRSSGRARRRRSHRRRLRLHRAQSDDGEDNDDHADEFEQAYKLRFEDPERSNEFLRSYAREVAAAKSVKREEKSGRKRQHELERERKEAEKKERREEKTRLKKLKLDEAQEELLKIKCTAGDDAFTSDEEGEGGEKKSKRPKKPKWDDDIDIKDLIPDFEDHEEKPENSLSDVEDGAAEEEDDEEDEDGRPSKKRKTDHKKARKESQKQARQERAKLEALVDSTLELSDHALLKQPSHTPFRYRETSPQSFGMTARDILLAPLRRRPQRLCRSQEARHFRRSGGEAKEVQGQEGCFCRRSSGGIEGYLWGHLSEIPLR